MPVEQKESVCQYDIDGRESGIHMKREGERRHEFPIMTGHYISRSFWQLAVYLTIYKKLNPS